MWTVYDGRCWWQPRFELSESHCDVDVKWFPFDVQRCSLVFESSTLSLDELNITASHDHAVDAMYWPSEEWDLTCTCSWITCINTFSESRIKNRKHEHGKIIDEVGFYSNVRNTKVKSPARLSTSGMNRTCMYESNAKCTINGLYILLSWITPKSLNTTNTGHKTWQLYIVRRRKRSPWKLTLDVEMKYNQGRLIILNCRVPFKCSE